MSAEVISFIDGEDLSPDTLQVELVEMLEELLVRAKSGAITAVGVAIVRSDGTIGTKWNMTHDFHSLGFAMAMLQNDYFRDFRGA